MSYTWSDGIPVLGELPAREAIDKLRALGDQKTSAELEALYLQSISAGGVMDASVVRKRLGEWWNKDCPWKHTGYEVGYIVPSAPTQTGSSQRIQSAREIDPDTTLKNKTLRITLDCFFVVAYPGGIAHRILLKFYTRHQTHGTSEDIHFNKLCRARDREAASITGSPIFTGLKINDEGVILGCESVEVTDEQDKTFLGFLESDAFAAGLQLLSTIQPVVGLVASTAFYITKIIAGRKSNSKVQEFEMRLGFDNATPSSDKLTTGSYVVVQTPGDSQSSWDWNDWGYQNGKIVRSRSSSFRLPYNYFIFGINIST